MKLAPRALNDPDRLVTLEATFDTVVTELVAMATDAGYSHNEALAALRNVVKYQTYASGEDPDPADDPDAGEIPTSDSVLF